MAWLWIAAIVTGLLGLALLAYSIGALDRRGAMASFVLGVIVVLTGGVRWLALLLAFTLMGVAATRMGYARKQARMAAEAAGGERGARNVVANGAAAALAAVSLLLDDRWVPQEAAGWAFCTAIAAVTADTLASELGALQARARLIVPPFPLAPAGRNGAVSWAGQGAALVGAAAIAVLGAWLLDLDPRFAWVAVLGGFLGCQLDSLLGATLEGDALHDRPLSKGDVNFISSALPALVVLVAFSL